VNGTPKGHWLQKLPETVRKESSGLVRVQSLAPRGVELTRFGGHLTVPDTEVFSEWIIEKA